MYIQKVATVSFYDIALEALLYTDEPMPIGKSERAEFSNGG